MGKAEPDGKGHHEKAHRCIYVAERGKHKRPNCDKRTGFLDYEEPTHLRCNLAKAKDHIAQQGIDEQAKALAWDEVAQVKGNAVVIVGLSKLRTFSAPKSASAVRWT